VLRRAIVVLLAGVGFAFAAGPAMAQEAATITSITQNHPPGGALAGLFVDGTAPCSPEATPENPGSVSAEVTVTQGGAVASARGSRECFGVTGFWLVQVFSRRTALFGFTRGPGR